MFSRYGDIIQVNIQHIGIADSFAGIFKIFNVFGRSSDRSTRISGFLISLLSPVLLRAVCGCFRESSNRKVELEDVEREEFEQLVRISTGHTILASKTDVWHVMRLAALADRFQMDDVLLALEDAAIRRLSIDSCAEILAATSGTETNSFAALIRVNEAAKALAAQLFEKVAETKEFGKLEGTVVEALLKDDALDAGRDEILALQAVCSWMRATIGDEAREHGRDDYSLLWRRAIAGLRFRNVERCRRRVQADTLAEGLSALRAFAALGGRAARIDASALAEDSE